MKKTQAGVIVFILMFFMLYLQSVSAWHYCGSSGSSDYIFWGGAFGAGGDVLMCREANVPESPTYCPVLYAHHEEMYGAYKWDWIASIEPDAGDVYVEADGPDGVIRIGMYLYTYSATAIIAKDSKGFDYRTTSSSSSFTKYIPYTNVGTTFAMEIGWHYESY